MIKFNVPELVNCEKIFSNKYGLFKIRVERGEDSPHSSEKSKRIFLYKWQNSWEFVFETKVSGSFESQLKNMVNSRIEEVVKISEAMFAPYNESVNETDKNIGSFLSKLKQYMSSKFLVGINPVNLQQI
jgi:hypothetical protein